MNFKEKIEHSIKAVEKWVESHNYKGYEPFDGLSSILRPLTFNNTFAERILQQAVRQAPMNLRPILGVKSQESTKGRAFMARGYLMMYQLTNLDSYRRKAVDCLDWLIENKSPNYSDFSWGNHFSMPMSFYRILNISMLPAASWNGYSNYHVKKPNPGPVLAMLHSCSGRFTTQICSVRLCLPELPGLTKIPGRAN